MQQRCKLRRFQLRISWRRMPLHGRKNKCRTELCDILHRHCVRNIQAESKRLNIFVKSRVFPAFLLFIECWGVCPKPGHKGLFVKSPLESQKLCKNKVVLFERSSLAYLSPKERYGNFQKIHLFTIYCSFGGKNIV